ncbi:MAG TPA: hypothetical protein VFZ25_02265 [Chloroflexota bacterium]|nr:hypothetical protein [Chloroflexota bacterium]
MISLARQIRLFLPPRLRRSRVSVDQVLAYLRGERDQPEFSEIGDLVARLPSLLREGEMRRRYAGFPRYLDVLPRIVFLYHRGLPASAISENLNFLATDVGVESVIQITARAIADRINQS